jgi:hypothetical protein
VRRAMARTILLQGVSRVAAAAIACDGEMRGVFEPREPGRAANYPYRQSVLVG